MTLRLPADVPLPFADRHIGPSDADIAHMLATLGCRSLDELIDQALPPTLRFQGLLDLPPALSEQAALDQLRSLAAANRPMRSLIGMGYYGTVTPAVIRRHILENPAWYTPYTPYQAEISQGRLEALLHFQTLVSELTGLPLANASLLDEATAAAEAMAMCRAILARPQATFFAADNCHPQVLNVLRTRAWSLDIPLQILPPDRLRFPPDQTLGVLLPYPATDGAIYDWRPLIDQVHQAGGLAVLDCDPLALTLLTPPGQLGADIAVGSMQRFGLPMGLGGPHAAFLATRMEFVRKMPGRLVGLSVDAQGRPACRLAIQTREQHIRRDKATSNICTSQSLSAIAAVMYAIYHGPSGLQCIAQRIYQLTRRLAEQLLLRGHDIGRHPFFDTLRIRVAARHGIGCAEEARLVLQRAQDAGFNLRDYRDGSIGLSLDECSNEQELDQILSFFPAQPTAAPPPPLPSWPDSLCRRSDFLSQPVFHRYHSELELLRYIKRLESRDLSLATSMIPLGSCTMKLNPTAAMEPISWPQFANIHPYAPADQWPGYQRLIKDLETWLAVITGLPAVSLQPNAGSQGEYAGLLAIRAYHASRNQSHRRTCLIPTSAHGTNPASAVMAGFQVLPVACDRQGNVDLADLETQARTHADHLAAIMITYPSTHGVFETAIPDICRIVHQHGGLVYLDGANMNAMVGLCRPADLGADLCHLNLHKTFALPHGGGGPGMAALCAAEFLRPFLPAHPLDTSPSPSPGPVAAAPFGSALLLTIAWMYIRLMGPDGLRKASQVAILNANYLAARLASHYPILYRGAHGRVAHEFILDCRPFEHSAGIRVDDIAKRLMDYGFHAPTMSWPVPGTLMIEPTESESLAELDRFAQALILIRQEIAQIEHGQADPQDNPLKNAPHPHQLLCNDAWPHPYSRQQAAYPAPWLQEHKYWPPVSRIDNARGDRQLICTCHDTLWHSPASPV